MSHGGEYDPYPGHGNWQWSEQYSQWQWVPYDPQQPGQYGQSQQAGQQPGDNPWYGGQQPQAHQQQYPQYGPYQQGQYGWEGHAGQYGPPGQYGPAPGQQQWTQPPSPGKSGQGKSGNGKTLGFAVGGGGLAAVVAIALVLVFVWPGGSTGGTDDEGRDSPTASGSPSASDSPAVQPYTRTRKVAWKKFFPKGDAGSSSRYSMLAAYVRDNTVIRASPRALVAYDLATGKKKWTLKPPRGFRFCAASPAASSQGVAGLAIGKKSDTTQCAGLAAVDLTQPKILWTKTPSGGSLLAFTSSVVTTDSAIYHSGSKADGVYAYDPASGERLWMFRAGQGCGVDALRANSDTVLTVVECSLADKYVLTALNADAGDVAWQAEIPVSSSYFDVGIVHVSPATVYVGSTEGSPVLHIYGESGKHQAAVKTKTVVKAGPLKIDPLSSPLISSTHSIFPVGIVNETLVAVVGDSTAKKVAAIDLTTGKVAWVTNAPAPLLVPVHSTIEDATWLGLLGAQSRSGPGRMYTVNVKTGKIAPGGSMQRPKGDWSLVYLTGYTRIIRSDRAIIQMGLERFGSSDYPKIVVYR